MAVLTVNGAEMPSPSELRVKIFDVGSSGERTASGRLAVDRVAVKRALTLRWAALSTEEMSRLLGAVGASVFFEAEYPDPEVGSRAMICRCEERTAGVLRMENGAPVWKNIEMTWTER